MKKLTYFLMLFFPTYILAQNVAINNDGSLPHPNAMLDVKGENKGLLIPRGDAFSRAFLNTNTARGLLMYDSSNHMVWIHNGNGLASGWKILSYGINYWTQIGALGTEITNTNSGGFWSSNTSTVLAEPGPLLPPVSGAGTRLFWMPQQECKTS